MTVTPDGAHASYQRYTGHLVFSDKVPTLRVRAEAIEGCATLASSPGVAASEVLEWGSKEHTLMCEALWALPVTEYVCNALWYPAQSPEVVQLRSIIDPALWLQAQGLLETGWCIGETPKLVDGVTDRDLLIKPLAEYLAALDVSDAEFTAQYGFIQVWMEALDKADKISDVSLGELLAAAEAQVVASAKAPVVDDPDGVLPVMTPEQQAQATKWWTAGQAWGNPTTNARVWTIPRNDGDEVNTSQANAVPPVIGGEPKAGKAWVTNDVLAVETQNPVAIQALEFTQLPAQPDAPALVEFVVPVRTEVATLPPPPYPRDWISDDEADVVYVDSSGRKQGSAL